MSKVSKLAKWIQGGCNRKIVVDCIMTKKELMEKGGIAGHDIFTADSFILHRQEFEHLAIMGEKFEFYILSPVHVFRQIFLGMDVYSESKKNEKEQM